MFHHVFWLTHPGGGYTYFGEAHHLPALFYLHFSFLGLVLASLAAIAILVILLPALHRKLPSLLIGMTAIITGFIAGYGLLIPEWQVGHLDLPDRPLSYHPSPVPHLITVVPEKAKNDVEMDLRIGLVGVNFTMVHFVENNITFYYDERIEFDSLPGMRIQFIHNLQRGLPVALLEIQEQVAGCGDEGFLWPYHLRQAGYYCSWLLAAVVTLWAISCLLVISIPKLGAATLGVTGIFLMLAPILYCVLIPATAGPAGRLRVSGQQLTLHFGPCLWVCGFGGLWTTAVGLLLYAYHVRWPHHFFTDFDVDYDEHEQLRRKTITAESSTSPSTPTTRTAWHDTRL